MKEDLIFHLVKKEDWKKYKKEARYRPESLDSQGFIHCSSGRDVEDTANRLFKGEEDVLLIVINTTLIEPELRYENDGETGPKYPHIYGPLNLDAVIDKIELATEDDGTFEISFSEN